MTLEFEFRSRDFEDWKVFYALSIRSRDLLKRFQWPQLGGACCLPVCRTQYSCSSLHSPFFAKCSIMQPARVTSSNFSFIVVQYSTAALERSTTGFPKRTSYTCPTSNAPSE